MDLSAVSNFQVNQNIADFGPGDRVKVSAKVVEGDRERIQVFEGDVIRVRNGGPASDVHGSKDLRRHRRGAYLPYPLTASRQG